MKTCCTLSSERKAESHPFHPVDMPLMKREKLLVKQNISIRETMRLIDQSAIGIALVVDSDDRLLGTVTDGDLRRAVLAGRDLNAPVAGIMFRDPVTVTPSMDTQDIRKVFIESTLKHIPVVDGAGRVVDLLLVSDLLSVPLSNPDITDRERQAVLEVLQTAHLSLGPKVVEFEKKIAAFVGRKHAIAVNSGTSGLHLIVKSMGLGPGDEVITTPFSFIASSNCLLFEGATPVFVDIESDTYNIDPEKIEAAITGKTKAILVVDVFGQPVRYDEIERIAQRHGLKIISDCCESIGSEYRGRRSGSFGAAGVFAFYPNKQITTGEGGVIVTDDDELTKLCRSYRNQGRGEKGGWLCHERIGYNYRLPDICCAMGIVQLERIEEIVEKRQEVADMYARALGDFDELILPTVRPEVNRISWFVYVVRLADRFTRERRDGIIQTLNRHGIGANSYFQPIHLQPFYVQRFGFIEGMFPVAEFSSQRTIALPFHNSLTGKSIQAVADRLKSALAEPVGA